MGSRRSVKIGTLIVGGNAPVRVESMLKTPLSAPRDCEAELSALAKAGCELVRVSFQDTALAAELKQLSANSPIPLMADIHFSYKLALEALNAGCLAIRINPGNMCGHANLLREVTNAAKGLGAVIRVGSNGGSLSDRQLEAARGDRGAALVLAVTEQVNLLNDNGFEEIIISAKSSDVLETVRANALLAQKYPYPIHIGITEAGRELSGTVKGAAGISIMLAQGIGDTIRVSLTAPGVEEVKTGYHILRCLKMRSRGVNLISCPTCGRKRIDVLKLAQYVEESLPENLPDDFTVAVMGCEVNGPREAANADLGIAGTASGFVIFQKGRPLAIGEMERLPELINTAIKNCLR